MRFINKDIGLGLLAGCALLLGIRFTSEVVLDGAEAEQDYILVAGNGKEVIVCDTIDKKGLAGCIIAGSGGCMAVGRVFNPTDILSLPEGARERYLNLCRQAASEKDPEI